MIQCTLNKVCFGYTVLTTGSPILIGEITTIVITITNPALRNTFARSALKIATRCAGRVGYKDKILSVKVTLETPNME